MDCQEVANIVKTRKEMTSDVGMPTIHTMAFCFNDEYLTFVLEIHRVINVVNKYHLPSMVTTRAQSRAKPLLKIELDSPFALKYFAEGAAYIVYQLGRPLTRLPFEDKDFESSSGKDGQPTIDPRLKGKLLRLRKQIPSSVPVIESHDFFKRKIEPLFPQGMLLEQELCELSPELLNHYNKELKRDEKQQYLRNRGRAGTYLAEDEPNGTLITSMLYDEKHASCHFKPKWLIQSPSAPEGSKRCRNCAMQAKHKKVNDFHAFCPLVLTSNDGGLLEPHLLRALSKMRGAPIDMFEQVSYAIPFLLRSPMLHRLKELQGANDTEGPLGADPNSEKYRLAMTLRDCTMFMKASLNPDFHKLHSLAAR